MKELIDSAQQARINAYAPYSKYRVGAAVLGADGNIYTGVNVENLSYGATVCAERVAIFSMVAAGCKEFKALAVATRDSGTPCGMCRQVLAEFSHDHANVDVYCIDESGNFSATTLDVLLPNWFSAKIDTGEEAD